jgi:hypothetical protein
VVIDRCRLALRRLSVWSRRAKLDTDRYQHTYSHADGHADAHRDADVYSDRNLDAITYQYAFGCAGADSIAGFWIDARVVNRDVHLD